MVIIAKAVPKICFPIKERDFPYTINCTTHIEKIDNSLIKYTQEFNDEESLVNLIKETELLISVDTVAIHLAQFFNISTIILSSSWKKFIPPNLIANNRLFGINKPIDLFNALDAAT